MLISIWFDGSIQSANIINDTVNELCSKCETQVIETKQGSTIEVFHVVGVISKLAAPYLIIQPDTLVVIDNEDITVIKDKYEIATQYRLQEKAATVTEKLDKLREYIKSVYITVTDVELSTTTTGFMESIGGKVLDIDCPMFHGKKRKAVLHNNKVYITINV